MCGYISNKANKLILEDYCLLECDTTYSDGQLQTLWKNMMPPFPDYPKTFQSHCCGSLKS
jgi:hypothetical protein